MNPSLITPLVIAASFAALASALGLDSDFYSLTGDKK